MLCLGTLTMAASWHDLLPLFFDGLLTERQTAMPLAELEIRLHSMFSEPILQGLRQEFVNRCKSQLQKWNNAYDYDSIRTLRDNAKSSGWSIKEEGAPKPGRPVWSGFRKPAPGILDDCMQTLYSIPPKPADRTITRKVGDISLNAKI